jgi:hypothetical protein
VVNNTQLLEFIRRNVRSVWALELLLMLREQPRRAWSMSELVGQLRASHAVVTGVLVGFEQGGLVAREPGGAVRFAAGAARLDHLCDALAEAYRERPMTVIKSITVADTQIEGLAEAFQFRKRCD